jgi:hypothetical protein
MPMSIGLLDAAPMADKARIVPAKLHADVMETARIVAAYKGVQIQDLLSDILRPILRRMHREEVEKASAEWSGGEPPARPGGRKGGK